LHLSAASPCRDAGRTSIVQPDWLDLDGAARVVGTAVDIGADEFDGTVPQYVPLTVRVSNAGDDANDGSSWSAPKRTIQAAIEAVTLNGGEVWVQSGTYHENLALRFFVGLYGGFVGNETARAQRDWRVNPTALDGGRNGPVVSGTNIFQ